MSNRGKQSLKRTFCMLLACLMSLIVFVQASYAQDQKASQEVRQTITMCVDEWPPKISKDLPEGGPQVRSMRAIFGHVDADIRLHWAPWKRCIENVSKGIWDTSPGWSMSADRKTHLIFSEPYTTSYQVFFYLDGTDFDWADFEDLVGLHIGITEGYSYGDEFTAATKKYKLKTEEVKNDALNFQKLILGRVDIIAMNISTGFAIAEKNLSPGQLVRVRAHERKIGDFKHSHVIFTKNERGQRLAELFNKGLVLSSTNPALLD